MDKEANAIIPAKIGVEHGVPASAKTAPIKIGYKTMFLPELCGISFISTGKLKSSNPMMFKPITISKDANNKIKYVGAKETKTLPVTAQRTPIVAKTREDPKTKNTICNNVLSGVPSEYPPTYPIIIGSIAKEHGDTDAKSPPKKDTASIIKLKCPEWDKL